MGCLKVFEMSLCFTTYRVHQVTQKFCGELYALSRQCSGSLESSSQGHALLLTHPLQQDYQEEKAGRSLACSWYHPEKTKNFLK